MFILVSSLIFVFLLSSNSAEPSGSKLREASSVAYNGILGIASTNVPAYSNGNDSFISKENHFINGVFMGMKWQCVEFARRWTYIRKGSTFESVDGAKDIWNNVKSIERLSDKKQIPLKRHPNGSPDKPTNESYLIYPKQRDMPFGHVAVIVDVLADRIRIAEQNYLFHRWQYNYSREILWTHEHGRYFLKDDYQILGWIQLGDQQSLPDAKDIFSSSRSFWSNSIVRIDWIVFLIFQSTLLFFDQH